MIPENPLLNLCYHLFFGIPFCLVCMGAGILLCCTIIGIPAGLTIIAAG